MTTQFDLTQPVRTRDGRPARIVCTEARDLDSTDVTAYQFTSRFPRPEWMRETER